MRVKRACKNMIRKCYSLWTLFPRAKAHIKYSLFKTYCLPLYGAQLWRLNRDSCLLAKMYTQVTKLTPSHAFSFSSSYLGSFAVKINGIAIEKVSTTKYLGVFIDDKLNWTPHINYICGKLRKSIGILKRVKIFLTERTLITLYYSLLYPYITYCHLVWGKAALTHLKRFVVLQKKAIRIIYGEAFLVHTDLLFRRTKILRFEELYT